MSVILDALHKARRDTSPEVAGSAADTRAVEGGYRSGETRGKARRGLLVLVVLGSVAVTMLLCVGGFYLLALKLGLIERGWPLTASALRNGPGATPTAEAVGGGRVAVQSGAVTEVTSWDPGTSADAAMSGKGPIATPAPLSAVAGGGGLPPPADLPITVGHASQLPPPVPVSQLPGNGAVAAVPVAAVPAVATVSPATPAPTPAITVGTILCDETGCTAAVNGRTVRVGDVILDYTVMAITADKVTVQRAGEQALVLRPRM